MKSIRGCGRTCCDVNDGVEVVRHPTEEVELLENRPVIASPRRWCDLVGEENQIYLNKSELLMIREKLTNGNKNKDFVKTYNRA
ncbi:hypothetical protein IH922_07620 [candidate division KSB1 bacterium]|nr:hypothetical protein [candidate division KSB1 bacterium]